jgi:hypothetical protein
MEIPAAERDEFATFGVVAILCTLVHVSELPIILPVVSSDDTGPFIADTHVHELVVAVVIIILSRADEPITHEVCLCDVSGMAWAFIFHIVKGTRLFGCTESEIPTDRNIAAPPGTSVQSGTVVDHSRQPPAGTESSVAEFVVDAFLQCRDNVVNRQFCLELLGDQVCVGIAIATPVRRGLGVASAFFLVKTAVVLILII